MRSHLPTSIIAVATLVTLFAHVPTAIAQARGPYMPGLNTIKSAPPEANLSYAVIVIVPVAVTPFTTITFGPVGDVEPSATLYYAPVVFGWRSGRWESEAQATSLLVAAGRFRLSGIGTKSIYLTGNCRSAVRGQSAQSECTTSGTNVILSATVRF